MTEQTSPDLAAKVRQLVSDLARRTAEVETLHLEKRHLQADLAVKEAFIAELRIASPAVEREIALLREDQAKLDQIRAMIRKVPFASHVSRRLGRRARR